MCARVVVRGWIMPSDGDMAKHASHTFCFFCQHTQWLSRHIILVIKQSRSHLVISASALMISPFNAAVSKITPWRAAATARPRPSVHNVLGDIRITHSVSSGRQQTTDISRPCHLPFGEMVTISPCHFSFRIDNLAIQRGGIEDHLRAPKHMKNQHDR